MMQSRKSAPTKKPAFAGVYLINHRLWWKSPQPGPRKDLCESLDVCAEAALVTRSFVFVDQAAAGVAIHDRLGRLVRGFRACFIFGRDGIDDFLDGRAQHGSRARIARIAFDRLTCTLFGGLDIGQEKLRRIRDSKRGVSVSGMRVGVKVEAGLVVALAKPEPETRAAGFEF